MSSFKDLEVINEFYGVTTTLGDIIVNDGVKNNRLPVGSDNFVLTADSSEATGLKWAASQGGGNNSIVYINQRLTTLPISTNSTVFVSISQFQNTPLVGNYVILLSMTYSISKVNNRFATIGLFKNNILIADSDKQIESYSAGKKSIFYSQIVNSFNGTDVLTVKFNSNNSDSTVSIYDGRIILLRFGNSTQIKSNVLFSTNFTSPISITDMTNTAPSGLFLVLFNCIYTITKNNRSILIGLYKNGALIPGTEKMLDPFSNKRSIIQINTTTTFAAEEFTVKINSTNIDSTVSIYDRNLIFVPLD